MSFFEIGIYHTKTPVNIGTLWRSAFQFGAAGVFTVGRRYKKQHSDTPKTPRHIPLRHFDTMEAFNSARATGAVLVGVEMGGTPLSEFWHPKQAVYLLGAEDHGIPQEILDKCNAVVSIESVRTASFNVAVAGSLVMWHRMFADQIGAWGRRAA